nr:MAG TPA: hypothetical protein [Caudoviricetes sp.]
MNRKNSRILNKLELQRRLLNNRRRISNRILSRIKES